MGWSFRGPHSAKKAIISRAQVWLVAANLRSKERTAEGPSQFSGSWLGVTLSPPFAAVINGAKWGIPLPGRLCFGRVSLRLYN